MGSLDGRSEGMGEAFKPAAEHVDSLRGQIPLERQLPLWREERSIFANVKFQQTADSMDPR